MVSNASDDLPEPLKPVMTTSLSRGISSVRFLRLCSRAPPMRMNSLLMDCEFLDRINRQSYRSRTAKQSRMSSKVKNVKNVGQFLCDNLCALCVEVEPS